MMKQNIFTRLSNVCSNYNCFQVAVRIHRPYAVLPDTNNIRICVKSRLNPSHTLELSFQQVLSVQEVGIFIMSFRTLSQFFSHDN